MGTMRNKTDSIDLLGLALATLCVAAGLLLIGPSCSISITLDSAPAEVTEDAEYQQP